MNPLILAQEIIDGRRITREDDLSYFLTWLTTIRAERSQTSSKTTNPFSLRDRKSVV